ncbi:PREDICTED: FAR1-RELATED SEQUENCE, partial [Prunus dulcis]
TESAHAKLKRQLGSSQLNFERSWVTIHSLLELEHTEIKASFEKSLCFIQHRFRHPELRELVGFVSIKALSVIVCESESWGNKGGICKGKKKKTTSSYEGGIKEVNR